MAKSAAMAAKGSKGGAKKGGLGLSVLGFLILLLGLMMMPTSLLLVAGMIPTFIALLTDADPRKTSAVSVGALNLAGILPFEIMLWTDNNTVPHALQILESLETWLGMYGAASLGAVIYYGIPPIIGGFIAHRSAMRAQELQRRQAALREAWGPDVSSR